MPSASQHCQCMDHPHYCFISLMSMSYHFHVHSLLVTRPTSKPPPPCSSTYSCSPTFLHSHIALHPTTCPPLHTASHRCRTCNTHLMCNMPDLTVGRPHHNTPHPTLYMPSQWWWQMMQMTYSITVLALVCTPATKQECCRALCTNATNAMPGLTLH